MRPITTVFLKSKFFFANSAVLEGLAELLMADFRAMEPSLKHPSPLFKSFACPLAKTSLRRRCLPGLIVELKLGDHVVDLPHLGQVDETKLFSFEPLQLVVLADKLDSRDREFSSQRDRLVGWTDE